MYICMYVYIHYNHHAVTTIMYTATSHLTQPTPCWCHFHSIYISTTDRQTDINCRLGVASANTDRNCLLSRKPDSEDTTSDDGTLTTRRRKAGIRQRVARLVLRHN